MNRLQLIYKEKDSECFEILKSTLIKDVDIKNIGLTKTHCFETCQNQFLTSF